ncbi:MAG: hypothetical protein AAFQ60_08460, partial [Pseudomonadota bacterium]
ILAHARQLTRFVHLIHHRRRAAIAAFGSYSLGWCGAGSFEGPFEPQPENCPKPFSILMTFSNLLPAENGRTAEIGTDFEFDGTSVRAAVR